MKLSKENYEKLVWGGLYVCNDRIEASLETTRWGGGDQRYTHWVPAYHQDKDEIYMVNLYQMSGCRDYDTMVKQFEDLKTDGRFAIGKCFDYYYHANALIDDYNFDRFKLVLDLHDYHPINERKSYDYKVEDIVRNVRLYFEHAYPDGITLVRNGAQIDSWNKVEKATSELINWITEPRVWPVDSFLEMIKEEDAKGAHYNKRRVQAALEYHQVIQDMINEYAPKIQEIRTRMCNKHDDDEDQFLVDMCNDGSFGESFTLDDGGILSTAIDHVGTYWASDLPRQSKAYTVFEKEYTGGHDTDWYCLYALPRQTAGDKVLRESTLFVVLGSTEVADDWADPMLPKKIFEFDATKKNFDTLVNLEEPEKIKSIKFERFKEFKGGE